MKLKRIIVKAMIMFMMLMSVSALVGLYGQESTVSAEDKDIMDNYVVASVAQKNQVPRSVNNDGYVTYQMYNRNLKIDASSVSEDHLALSMRIFVKQVEGDKDPLEIFTAKNGAGMIELANSQTDLNSYLNFSSRNLKRADGSALVAGEWNDILLPFSSGTKKSAFDLSNITWFRFCLTRLPSDTGYQSVRLKDVNIVDTSRKAEVKQDESDKTYDTTYNVGNIDYTLDDTIKNANYVGAESVFKSPIDVTKHNLKKLQLQMDIDVENLTNEGSVAPLLDNNGKAYVELSSSGGSTDQTIQWKMKNLPWKNGKATYNLDFSTAETGTGTINYAQLNYMRAYFVHTTFTDQIKMKIDNVKIVDTTNVCTLPTIFSDGMMFQQNKAMTIWGNGKSGDEISLKLSNKAGVVVNSQSVKVATDGKWTCDLDAMKGGYDAYTLVVSDNGNVAKTIKDILIGEVWLAGGQSNMALNVGTDMDSEKILDNATNENLRFFLEPTYPNGQTGEQPYDPTYDIAGAYWGKGNDKAAVNKMSSVAYAYAKKLQSKLDVPVGVLNTPVGGSVIEAWMSHEAIDSKTNLITELEKRGLYYDKEFWSDAAGTMSTLYNQKIGPITQFKIAGTIWYQGESNSNRSEIYDTELSLLKQSWSEAFGFKDNSMPFIFTQVAPGQYDQGNTNMQHLGYLSAAMTRAFEENKNNNMAMLTIYDLPLDHVKNGVSSAAIHPRTKTPVGERFTTSAMNMVYGGTDAYTAPVYKSMSIKGNAIYINFDYVGKGLSLIKGTGDSLHGFSIAGADGIYVNAKAEIVAKNRIKVYSDRLVNPKNVNYAFNNLNYGSNLMNSAGIPVSPFRTQKITGTDTTYSPSKDITYFTANDWIYADQDNWVFDKDNPVAANNSLGYRPSWTTETGSYSYDQTNKAEGLASLKFSFTKGGTQSIGPVVTYGSQKIKYGNFKTMSVQMKNAEGAASSVKLQITSGGKTYTVTPEAGQEATGDSLKLKSENSFKTLTFDMTSLKEGDSKVEDPEALWNNLEKMNFVFDASQAGNVNIDDVSFGMTEPQKATTSNDPVASYDFGAETPAGVHMSTDKTEGKYTSETIAGKKAIKLGQYEYAHFQVDSSVVTKDDKNLKIRVTYYDNSNAYFGMQYNTITDKEAANETSDTKFKTASIMRGGSNKWVTQSICLSDASFRHAQFNKYDFRIYGNGTEGTYIAKVEVIKQAVDPDNESIGTRAGASSHSEFTGKSFAGYQAWFGTGSKTSSWGHYAYGSADEDGTAYPRKDHISIDYFPYVKDYDESALAQTGFANLGNGDSTKLYDSTNENVINTHFKWMNQYGIDGAAIQRFAGTINGRTQYDTPKDTLLYKIKSAAENNNRLFYMMYDISGGKQITDTSDTTSISPYVNDIKFDWVYNVEQSLGMLKSNAYATVNGKPVVCLWGTGVSGRPDRVADYQELIDFFHDRGCYVVFGVSRDWSTNKTTMEKYGDIFKQVDMISPWSVGSNVSTKAAIDSLYSSYVEKDWNWCKENDVDYQPVAFSGFSWSLWHNQDNAKPNQMPRNAGENLWYQAYKMKKLGIKSFYIAMFDEYDEGTAIAKNASDYFDIPTDQYFVTASCDGYWCSEDFQLRVAGEAIKMVKGERDAVEDNPVAQSTGPIYYRNSFESMYVNCPTEKYRGIYPVDPCFKNDKLVSHTGTYGTVAIEKNSDAKTGDYLVDINGQASQDHASYLYQMSETNITMTKGLKLSYSLNAQNEGGKNTNIVLLCKDGSHIVAHPSQSAVVGKWVKCTYGLSQKSMKGKVITGIALQYQGNKGDFKAFVDDITLEDNASYVVNKAQLSSTSQTINTLSQNDYTSESWKALTDASEAAHSLADDCSQEDMDEAVAKVQEAIKGLVKKTNTADASSTTPATPSTPSSQPVVTVNSGTKTLGRGEKFTLNVGGITTYSSSNDTIASIAGTGDIVAKDNGTVTISGYINNQLAASWTITVKKAPRSVHFKGKKRTLKRGKTYRIKAYLSKGSAGKITYTSKNQKIIKIRKDGKMYAVKKGKTRVVARTYNGKKATIQIKVK